MPSKSKSNSPKNRPKMIKKNSNIAAIFIQIPTTRKLPRKYTPRKVSDPSISWTPELLDLFEEALSGKGVKQGVFQGNWIEVASHILSKAEAINSRITLKHMESKCRNKWSDDKKQKNQNATKRYIRWITSATGASVAIHS